MKSFLVTTTATDGQRLVTFHDDAPDWVRAAVREAHDGEWPNNWRFEVCAQMLEALAEHLGDSPWRSADNAVAEFEESDAYTELIDGMVDTGHKALAQWLADDPSRGAYCEQWLEEIGIKPRTVWDWIAGGQSMALRYMLGPLALAVFEHREELR